MSILSSSRERVKSLLVLYHPGSEEICVKGARLVVPRRDGVLVVAVVRLRTFPRFYFGEKRRKTLVLAIVLYAVMISCRAVRVLVFLPDGVSSCVPLMAVHTCCQILFLSELGRSFITTQKSCLV